MDPVTGTVDAKSGLVCVATGAAATVATTSSNDARCLASIFSPQFTSAGATRLVFG